MTTDVQGFERPNSHPLYPFRSFVEDAECERAASIAIAVREKWPWIAPMLSARAPVTYASEPTCARPDAPLSVEDAAECATQTCVVLAELHARGWVGLRADSQDIRVLRDGASWRAEVVVPHLPQRGKFIAWRAARHDGFWKLDAVDRDLVSVTGFFVDLLAGYQPEETRCPSSPPPFELPSSIDAVTSKKLDQLLRSKKRRAVTCAAELAALFATLTRDPARWDAIIRDLPRTRPTELEHDWERMCELGEATFARTPRDGRTRPYLEKLLAGAHHQRACELFARGDIEKALPHVLQGIALDNAPRYLTTEGTLHCARGDYSAGLACFNKAARRANAEAKELSFRTSHNAALELARAKYAAAIAHWHLGDRDRAIEALRSADESIPAAQTRARELAQSVQREVESVRALIERALAKLNAT